MFLSVMTDTSLSGNIGKMKLRPFYSFALFWFIETMRNFNVFDKYKRNTHA